MDRLVQLVTFAKVTIHARVNGFDVFRVAFHVSNIPPLASRTDVEEGGSFLRVLTCTRCPLRVFVEDNDDGSVRSIVDAINKRFRCVTLTDRAVRLFAYLRFRERSVRVRLNECRFDDVEVAELGINDDLRLIPARTLLVVGGKR